jgi:hypothetical protein
MDSSPYISFVAVARNDNYGGDFLHRINVFVKVLLTLCERYELPSELIIVEWNPPEDRERLKGAISWPDIQRKYCQIRIIEVPNEVYRKLPNPANLPLFEYIGKNVGIRRAKGEYVLVTNPDIIFNEELIKFLALRKLSSKCFYRINRYDVKSPVPLDIPVEKQLEYCARNIIRVCGYWFTYENKLSKKLNLYRRLRTLAGYVKRRVLNFPYVPAHTNASGDFFLTHRNWLNTMRGYPELETKGKSHHIDGLIVYIAQFSGLRQIILKNPLKIYHQDHGRPESSKPYSQAVETAYAQLMKERRGIIFNDEKWGLGEENLCEECI